jgi:hypothetical protein
MRTKDGQVRKIDLFKALGIVEDSKPEPRAELPVALPEADGPASVDSKVTSNAFATCSIGQRMKAIWLRTRCGGCRSFANAVSRGWW